MKQQINFYDFLPKPPPYYLSVRLMGLVLLGFIGFLLLVTGLQAIVVQSQVSTVVSLQQQYEGSKKILAATKKIFELNNPESLKKELADKRKLLETLQSRKVTSGRCSLLSNYFAALAQDPVPGLWLTSISVNLNTDQIILAGNTSAPSLVLKLVRNLNDTVCFANRQFGPIDLIREPSEAANTQGPQGAIRFVMNSGKESAFATAQTGKTP